MKIKRCASIVLGEFYTAIATTLKIHTRPLKICYDMRYFDFYLRDLLGLIHQVKLIFFKWAVVLDHDQND